jgi:uncharacterized membrane protein YagU involved in acid resistance
MSNDPQTTPPSEPPDHVEMPRPTAAPLVLALGLTLLAAGVPFGLGFFLAGGGLTLVGLGMWFVQVLDGGGHIHEPLVEPEQRAQPVTGTAGGVERLREGMAGYRLRLPEKIHPISAGVKGGIVGGVAMTVPALVWSLLNGHGFLYPLNLLAGTVLPGVSGMSDQALEQFSPTLFLVGVVIHVAVSVVIGLIYGVLLPTLPTVPLPIAWGGILMPILWSGLSFVAMRAVNPAAPGKVNWPWFIVSQFVFGITMPAMVLGMRRLPAVARGVVGGLVGGASMAVPALLWSVATGHGLWYPVNLLAAMVQSDPGALDAAQLGTYHPEWLFPAIAVHLVLSITFGVLFALLADRLPPMPEPIPWGGLVLPLLWTGMSYSLMGVVNPALQGKVDWPWFVFSQFVFGVAAAIVVYRSEKVHIAPAGRGPDQGGPRP